jgi:hypothetical protein
MLFNQVRLAAIAALLALFPGVPSELSPHEDPRRTHVEAKGTSEKRPLRVVPLRKRGGGFLPIIDLFLSEPGIVDPPRLEMFSAFSRPRQQSDAIPRRLAKDVIAAAEARGALGYPETTPGLRLEESRLLLAEAASGKASLYAIPTTSGSLCYLLTYEAVVPRCVERLIDGVYYVSEDYRRRSEGGYHVIVHGVITDRVQRVEIVGPDGSREDALLGENAFFFEKMHAEDSSLLRTSRVEVTLGG